MISKCRNLWNKLIPSPTECYEIIKNKVLYFVKKKIKTFQKKANYDIELVCPISKFALLVKKFVLFQNIFYEVGSTFHLYVLFFEVWQIDIYMYIQPDSVSNA